MTRDLAVALGGVLATFLIAVGALALVGDIHRAVSPAPSSRPDLMGQCIAYGAKHGPPSIGTPGWERACP